MIIRNIRKEDIEEIKQITHEGAPFLMVYPDYVYWIFTELYPMDSVVAELDGTVVGFATGLPVPEKNSLFVWQLGVKKSCRKMGIAYKMLHYALSKASDRNLTGIITSISDQNPASLNTFQKIANEYHLTKDTIGKYQGAMGPAEDVYWFHPKKENENTTS